MIEQLSLAAHHFDVRRLYRHEHQHEIGTLHAGQVRVVLGRQGIDVIFHRLCVRFQRGGAFGIGFSGYRPLVVDQ